MTKNPVTPIDSKTHYALDGGESPDRRTSRGTRVMLGIAALGLFGGLVAANAGSDEGISAERGVAEAMADGEHVERANFAIHLRKGVKVRLTPEITKDSNGTSATDENVARTTEQSELIVGSVIAKDSDGVEWYGVPLGVVPEDATAEDIRDNMGWLSSEIFTQQNSNGEPFAERVYPDDSDALLHTPATVIVLEGEADPEQVLHTVVTSSTIGTDFDEQNGPGA